MLFLPQPAGVFPSLVIIMIIAAVLTNFAHLPVVQHAFGGIRVVVGVLIINAVSGMWKKSVVDKLGLVLAILSFIVATFVVSHLYGWCCWARSSALW